MSGPTKEEIEVLIPPAWTPVRVLPAPSPEGDQAIVKSLALCHICPSSWGNIYKLLSL